MALADTGTAIGQVTAVLAERLNTLTGITVSIGHLEAAGNDTARLNLWLYEAQIDPSLRSVPLDEGRPAPLWLVLKYLLTAYDDEGQSETVDALSLMGSGMRGLQEMNYLDPATLLLIAPINGLVDNPEPLKITFDEATLDVLSKVVQGPDSRYRFSMAFQVRPVMVATGEPPRYALPVGVDSTTTPATIIGEAGIRIPVLPSLGPRIESVDPAAVESGGTLTLRGVDLNLAGLSVQLGPLDLPIVMQRPDVVRAPVSAAALDDGTVSAGGYTVSVVQTLPTGRRRSSNVLTVGLVPTVTGVSAVGLNAVVGGVEGTVRLAGRLLGSEDDDVFVALYQEGRVVRVYDAGLTHAGDQTQLDVEIPAARPVPAGDYRVILRVNGQQARQSPTVSLVA